MDDRCADLRRSMRIAPRVCTSVLTFKLLRAKNDHRELLEARIVLVNTVCSTSACPLYNWIHPAPPPPKGITNMRFVGLHLHVTGCHTQCKSRYVRFATRHMSVSIMQLILILVGHNFRRFEHLILISNIFLIKP